MTEMRATKGTDVFAIPGAPKPKHEPTYAEAVTLTGNVRKIRDSINRELVRFYNFEDVRNIGLTKQIDLLQALALQFSSTSIPEPIPATRPDGAPSCLPSDSPPPAPPASPAPRAPAQPRKAPPSYMDIQF